MKSIKFMEFTERVKELKGWQVGLMGLCVGVGFVLLFGSIMYVGMRDAKPSAALLHELRKPTKKEIEKISKGIVYAMPPAKQEQPAKQ